MIISPPFLRNRTASQSDADWTGAMMPVNPDQGFPLNGAESWHGGIHITHTDEGMPNEKIRAIADGVVVSFRQPSPSKDAEPLNYLGPTDDGYVLLKHETETGSGDDGKVVFYSLCMHMKFLEAEIKQDAKIYRKAPLGSSGTCSGRNEFHFQIFCDDNNISKLTGRTTRELDVSKDGRTDAVYGDIHFYLPAGTKFYDKAPANNSTSITGLSELYTSSAPLYASMTLAQGSCTMVTRQKNTQTDGKYDLLGDPLVNADGEDYEYNLYNTAMRNYKESPSAGFELLRFGRVINTEHETLVPADAPLWMTVSYPGGKGVVNLADPNIKKFSDADFPHWTGWQLVDDDTDSNSQCSSAIIRKLQEDGEYNNQCGKLICHFPFEWEKSTFDTRFSWLKTGNDKRAPMTEADYAKFKAHAEALCFDSGAFNSGRLWHFEPNAFIEHFRKCSWMNLDELAATFPKYLFYSSNGNPRTAQKQPASVYTIDHEQAKTRIELHYESLNLCIRKYIGNDKKRISFFLPQTLLETAQWRDLGGSKRLLHEWGFGRYNSVNPATEYYTVFYGRGIMQLTWAGLYKTYGEYRNFPNHSGSYTDRLRPDAPRLTSISTHYAAHPDDGGTLFRWSPRFDPDIVAEDKYNACDSGGFYWASKVYRRKTSMNRVADEDFTADNVGLINRLVNGGSNGYYERQAYSKFIGFYLMDEINTDATVTVSPTGKSRIVVDLTKS
ncbi:M23 family metallopeptidase [Enterobacter hormaechei]|uniref:M23 family metallopeptidase n=1 Tax=Enterobacter hormaechei TaxID=158836 RepID=UPI0024DE1416|nr:M23 family metallopeptidase [Enterobacter hormaechei]MDK2354595.1 M23 family metallopeptidase [Enterobacter hormaechei]WRM01436.1 M23 family metallopeptidase [Enterobacter hormaechei]WRM09152.1 M23 family metallopeptidase [Enterobacter hormaechei]HBL8927443.1 M23 family peptidase [Enterobacter hormaechei]